MDGLLGHTGGRTVPGKGGGVDGGILDKNASPHFPCLGFSQWKFEGSELGLKEPPTG